MNEIERQILVNQNAIMKALGNIPNNYNSSDLKEKEAFTLKLLFPEEQPSIAERTHDAFSQLNEVKKE